jgi:hypothetical protein
MDGLRPKIRVCGRFLNFSDAPLSEKKYFYISCG